MRFEGGGGGRLWPLCVYRRRRLILGEGKEMGSTDVLRLLLVVAFWVVGQRDEPAGCACVLSVEYHDGDRVTTTF